MGLKDLFQRNQEIVFARHGKGVSAESVKLIDPVTGAEDEIFDFVFEDTTASEILLVQSGDQNDKLGEIELPLSYRIREKHSFRINGEIWQTRGHGGSDGNRQTILLKLPKENSHRQTRARGT